MDKLAELAVDVLAVILPVLVPYLAWQLNRYLRARMGAERLGQVQAWAWQAVQAAEQLMEGNPEKLQYVLGQVAEFAEGRGIHLTPRQLEVIIEGTVRMMRGGGGTDCPLKGTIAGKLTDGTDGGGG